MLGPSFWQRVRKTPDCWLWVGHLNNKGYGTLGRQYAHRLAYEDLRGPIPVGLQIDHLCRVRNCVNPDHMEPVTQTVNTMRGQLHNRLKTHCPRGHAYTPETTWYYQRPGQTGEIRTFRQCKACRA